MSEINHYLPQRSNGGVVVAGRSLLAGTAHGEVLVLDEPLSLWGGVDLGSGRIVDAHHPQYGEVISGRILAMSSGRGSSSSSSVLAEMIRRSVAPQGVLLSELDEIIVVGALVGRMMYEERIPFLLLSETDFAQLETGLNVEIRNELLRVVPGP